MLIRTRYQKHLLSSRKINLWWKHPRWKHPRLEQMIFIGIKIIWCECNLYILFAYLYIRALKHCRLRSSTKSDVPKRAAARATRKVCDRLIKAAPKMLRRPVYFSRGQNVKAFPRISDHVIHDGIGCFTLYCRHASNDAATIYSFCFFNWLKTRRWDDSTSYKYYLVVVLQKCTLHMPSLEVFFT